MIYSILDRYVVGIEVLGGSIPKAVTKEADGTLTLHLENGTVSCRTILYNLYSLLY